MRMNKKRQIFADYYIETVNATQSAIKAGYSKKTAYSQGLRLLKNVEIKNYIKTTMDKKDSERIASQDEILEFLSNVLRGEIVEESFNATGEKIYKKPTISDKLRVCEMFCKIYGLFDKDKDEKTQVVNIIYDIPKK
jgi:phage terminase small subunit